MSKLRQRIKNNLISQNGYMVNDEGAKYEQHGFVII